MIVPTGPFSRAERIRRASEFRAISQTGRRRSSGSFVVLAAPCSLGDDRARLGLTVSRRVGDAVARNRVKRRVREWFRLSGRRAGVGLDLVVIARAGAAELVPGRTAEELTQLIESIR